jgi:hypothetical protein
MNASLDLRSPLARAAAAVMVCNPFLLLSPMFLLYGIYRAVVAPNLFHGDTANTLFNFVALSLYILLVCVTSTLLARKRIMPDTMMLLILHALLFVAPFLLIAHSVFLEGPVAISLGAGGIGCGLAQLFALRKRLPDTFVSPQLIAGGALILAVNFAAPMLFRHRLENSNEAWTLAGAYAWNLLLPLLVAWMNLLPNRVSGPMLWSRTWFAFATFLLWLAGTVIQLWSVAYVDDRALHAHQFTVALWVLAWTALRRASILPERYAEQIRAIAPASIFLIPALGGFLGLDLNIACALFALNIPLLLLKLGRLPAIALAALSFIAALCCLPVHWMHFMIPSADRAQFVAVTFAALVIGVLAYARDSRAGFVGSLSVAVGISVFTDYSGTLALNIAILFLFLHQLRWSQRRRDEKVLLTLAGVIWIAQTLALDLSGSTDARIAPFIATIVATICLRNASVGLSTSLIPPTCSIVALLIHPLHRTIVTVSKAPSGAIAIVLGFALLGIGAWHALKRTRKALL